MRVERRVFRDETVALDGNEFVDCVFERCCLTFAGGNCSLTGCRLEEGGVKFIGPAQNTVKFLNALSKLGSGFQEGIAKEIDGLYKFRVAPPPN